MNLTEAYLEYLRKELHSAEAETAKVSQEIERLSKAHAEGLLLHLQVLLLSFFII